MLPTIDHKLICSPLFMKTKPILALIAFTLLGGLLCTNHPDADVFNVTWTQWKELEYPAGFKEHLYTAARELPMTDTWKKLSLLPIMPSLKYTVSF